MIDVEEFLTYIREGKVPPNTPSEVEIMQSEFAYREQCLERGMWALVDLQWTKHLADWIGKRKVLEVMAGRRWFAWRCASNKYRALCGVVPWWLAVTRSALTLIYYVWKKFAQPGHNWEWFYNVLDELAEDRTETALHKAEEIIDEG